MTTIDFSPLYRRRSGFDRMANALDVPWRGETNASGYPSYDIEVLDENRYQVTLAVPGFDRGDLDVQVEKGVLAVEGHRVGDSGERKYLHKGIAARDFERQFTLAEHVEVVDAKLNNGLLIIDLVRQIPEAMKPRSIPINGGTDVGTGKSDEPEAA